MDIYEAIRRRSSVRSYSGEPIDDAVLNRILDAGRLAPSARNRQQWKFVLVRSEALRRELAVKVCRQPWMAQAAVILAGVSTDPYTMYCDVEAGAVDLAIALDHMVLAATAEGLGTCWIGHFDQQACKQLLGIGEPSRVIELLTIGQGKEQSDVPKVRKALDEVVCYDRFA
jgi:nitroreductase